MFHHTWSRVLLTGFIAFAVLGVVRADDEKKQPEEKKPALIAHIRLAGDLEEKPPSSDPLTGSLSETLRTKLERLKKAQDDKDVQAVFLEFDGLGIGWGKLDELTQAIAKLRKAGKKVYAYAESGEAKDYLAALACDEVCLPESSWLMLTGMRIEVSFYKDLFEKIGVQADMLQMGDFKGAAEPYTRTSLSEANRKQLTSVLDDRFDHGLVGRIAEARKKQGLTPAKVKKLIDGGPYSATAAKKAGLIDHVNYFEDFQKKIEKGLKADNVKLVKNYAQKKADEIDFSSPFAILKLLSPPKPTTSNKPKIAVIYATGAIMTGKGGSSLMGGDVVGSDTMIKAIQQAEADKTVKAIVLRVDSPGGSALASDLIWNELVKCKKPVIASMSDVAASGGYYISAGAKKIYAEPGTLTGSIGVVGGKLATGGVWDKVGIKTEVISRGAHSGILSSTEPFSKSERETFRALMAETYDQFLTKSLKGRERAGKKMTRDELEKLAGGRIWTGRQAKENGLVDELGTLDDAIAEAKKMAGVAGEELELLQLPKARSLLDTLLDSKSDARLGAVQLKALDVVPGLKEKLRPVEGLLQLRGEPVWAVMPYRVEVK